MKSPHFVVWLERRAAQAHLELIKMFIGSVEKITFEKLFTSRTEVELVEIFIQWRDLWTAEKEKKTPNIHFQTTLQSTLQKFVQHLPEDLRVSILNNEPDLSPLSN
jgi:hypothetical protein